MIELTSAAKEQIDGYFADKQPTPIRIFLAGGCGGPRLALALDEPRDADDVVEVQGYTFVIDKELYGKAAPLTVDMGMQGFLIKSDMHIEGGGGGCSGCTSCG